MRYAHGLTHGVALGAGLMFLLDPRQGGARRALVRDKSVRVSHELEHAANVGARDLSHRLEGAVARLFAPRAGETVGDDVLVERVRARLGHVCSHPHTIEVIPRGEGTIELKGPVLANEKAQLVASLGRVRGVRAIDDNLEAHAGPDIPALQCTNCRPMRRGLARPWTPATRLIVGATAAAAALASLVRGHPIPFLLGGAATLAIARSMSQQTIRVRQSSAGSQPVTGLREAYGAGSEWAPPGETH